MMSLAPPYYIFEGVPVFADAQDPDQFYYFPNRPHFATDEHGRPAVRFIAMKEDPGAAAPGEDDVVGFLFFDTAIDWPEATLKKVAGRIRSERKLDREPRLVPLLYRSGTVRLMFLDKITALPGGPDAGGAGAGADGAAAGEGTDTPSNEWVTVLESSGVPSLYGENRAIFSAELTKKATQLLYASFDGFIPAGIVYDLTFDAMQPAFHINIHADWNQVYKFVKDKHTIELIFYSSDIEKTVTSLIDTKVIQVTSAIEGVGEEGMEGQYNEVRKQLLAFVLDTFFKPTPNPNKPDSAIQDGIVGTLRQLRDLGSPINVGYQRVELSADELRTLDIDYDVSRAVQRHISPQGHLNLFFSDYNLTKDDVVTVVDTRDSIFRDQEFTVAVSAPFDTDGIEAVTVDVAYGQPKPPPANADVWSFLFKRDTPEQKRSDWFDPAVGDQVQYRYEAVFSSAKANGPDLKLDSDWQDARGTIVLVTPEELYHRRALEVQVHSSFPFASYPSIQIELRYTSPDGTWTYERGTLLESGTVTWTPSFWIHQDWPDEVEYRLTYFHAAGNLETDWTSTKSDRIDISDPRHNLFTAHVIVAGNRADITEIVVDLRYEDVENNIFESQSFTIDSSTFDQPHDFVFPRADPANDRYLYSQVIVMNDGTVITTGEVQSNSVHLLVGPVFAKKWDVQPILTGPPIDQNGLDKITVQLHYEDDENAYTSDQTVVFTSPGPGENWSLELKDPAKRQYTYKIIYEDTSGFDHVYGPRTSTDTFLMIPSTRPA